MWLPLEIQYNFLTNVMGQNMEKISWNHDWLKIGEIWKLGGVFSVCVQQGYEIGLKILSSNPLHPSTYT